MLLFLSTWASVLFYLGVLGLCGGFVLRPFLSADRKYLILAAPTGGLCALSLCLSFGYLGGLSFQRNLWLSLTGCGGFTAAILLRDWMHGVLPAWRTLRLPAIALLVVSAVCTLALNESTFRAGGPALLYMEGTDTLGYSHLADWLETHKCQDPAAADPAMPYQSWVNFVLTVDTRYGTYLLHSALAYSRASSGAFSYDLGCTIAISAGLLAFAAGFASSPAILFGLLAAAAVGGWLDISRTGFLGKLLAYPAVTFIISILLREKREHPYRAHMLALLAFGATLLHSGASVGFFTWVACLGLFFFPLRFALNYFVRERAQKRSVSFCDVANVPALFDLVFVCAICVLTWMFLVRGALFPPVDVLTPWRVVFNYSMDLANYWTGIPDGALIAWFLAACVIHVVLAALALWRGQFAAAGLLVAGPVYLLIGRLLNMRGIMLQALGMFYPLALGGAALLWESSRGMSRRIVIPLVILIALLVGFRVPRFVGATHRWLGSGVATINRFSKSTVDSICEKIGTGRVELQVPDVYRAAVMMVEMGRRNIDFHLDPATWWTLLSYRQWVQPSAYNAPDYVLQLSEVPINPGMKVLFKNHQYTLLKPEPELLKKESVDTSDPVQGLVTLSGLSSLEGPYPQWNLPKVRWGLGLTTYLSVGGGTGGSATLQISGRGSYPGQSVSLFLDEHEIGTHAFTHADVFEDFEIQFKLPAGTHILKLRSLLCDQSNHTKPGSILYSRLRLITEK